MTLEELNKYRKLKKEIKALNAQIDELYNTPLPSKGESVGYNPSEVSDPTAAQAMKIIRKKEILEMKVARAEVEEDRIEAWLDSVTDPEIRAIVRFRFLLGYTWRRTSSEVYGFKASEEIAKVKIYRFLNL